MEYLIDIRTQEEFSDGHYGEAIHHELILLKDDLLPEYSKDSTIYLYGRTISDTEQAKKILQENGFTNVTNLGGYDSKLDQEESV